MMYIAMLWQQHDFIRFQCLAMFQIMAHVQNYNSIILLSLVFLGQGSIARLGGFLLTVMVDILSTVRTVDTLLE